MQKSLLNLSYVQMFASWRSWMHLRAIGRQFTQMNAYLLVMNSKRCIMRIYACQKGTKQQDWICIYQERYRYGKTSNMYIKGLPYTPRFSFVYQLLFETFQVCYMYIKMLDIFTSRFLTYIHQVSIEIYNMIRDIFTSRWYTSIGLLK